MDLTRLNQGEKIAGVSGIVLFLIMIIFQWFGIEATVSFGAFGGASAETTRNAFGAYGFIDIVLLITCIAAVGLALLAASESQVSLPVAASAIVAGLGILSVVLIIISIISPPNFSGVDLPSGVDTTRKIGVWLGLIAAAVLTYGAWRAMQEEGTSFRGEADRFRDTGTGPGAGPGPSAGPGPGTGGRRPTEPSAPPPPPPSQPPPPSNP